MYRPTVGDLDGDGETERFGPGMTGLWWVEEL
jgi:hypothetical protein